MTANNLKCGVGVAYDARIGGEFRNWATVIHFYMTAAGQKREVMFSAFYVIYKRSYEWTQT